MSRKPRRSSKSAPSIQWEPSTGSPVKTKQTRLDFSGRLVTGGRRKSSTDSHKKKKKTAWDRHRAQTNLGAFVARPQTGLEYELQPPKKRRKRKPINHDFPFERGSFTPTVLDPADLPPGERPLSYWFNMKAPHVRRRVYKIIHASPRSSFPTPPPPTHTGFP